MFARFQVIELNKSERCSFDLLEPALLIEARLMGQESELPNDGFSVHAQHEGRAPLRNAGCEKEPEAVVELPFFLSVGGQKSSGRERSAAPSALIPWDVLAIGASEVASFSDDGSGFEIRVTG